MSATTVRSTLSACLAALLAALALWAALAHPAAASDVWTTATSEENVPVQACAGFDIVTSYTLQREYRVVTGGARYETWEQQRVQFAGTFANTTTDASLAYAGRFLRTANLDAGTVAISGLWLQLVPPDEEFNVATISGARESADDAANIVWQSAVRPADPIEIVASRIAGDLPDSPPAIVLEVGPPEVTWRLCQLLGGAPLATPETPAQLHDCALISPRNSEPC